MIRMGEDYENRTLWFIYVLVDPRTDDEFYVGLTRDPLLRMREHINQSRILNTKQYASSLYIREIIAAGYRPQMEVIDCVITSNKLKNQGDAKSLEKFWIKEFKSRGKAWCNNKPAIMNVS